MGQRAWVGGRLLPPSPASLCTGHGQHRIPNTCQFMPWFLWPHAPVNMSLHVCGRSHGSLPLPPKIPQNNLDELWALFDLACGEALLGDRRHFHSHFGSVISRAQERDASTQERHAGDVANSRVQDLITPYFLRREKAVVYGVHSGGKALLPRNGPVHNDGSAGCVLGQQPIPCGSGGGLSAFWLVLD